MQGAGVMISQQPVGLPSGKASLYQYIVIKLLDDRAGEMAQKPNALATLPEDPHKLTVSSREANALFWFLWVLHA